SYFFNSRDQDDRRIMTEIFDPALLETDRQARLEQHRDRAAENGLLATLLEADESSHRVALLVRRADAWFARFLKPNDRVVVTAANSRSTSDQFTVAEVRPDYARMRVLLDIGSSALPRFAPGEEVRIQMKIPGAIDYERPPDLDRFGERQDRIDYSLSTIYCSCGMIGTSCAGHWN